MNDDDRHPPPPPKDSSSDSPAAAGTGEGSGVASSRVVASPTTASPAAASSVTASSAAEEIDALRAELERRVAAEPTPRWNADPDDVERSVIQLVLTLVEFIRQLLERQALRRMDEETLTEDQVEAVGRALMRLEETVHDLAERFDIPPEKLNLDLGPLGRLL